MSPIPVPFAALEIFGIKLVGANAQNARKVLFTVVFLAGYMGARFGPQVAHS